MPQWVPIPPAERCRPNAHRNADPPVRRCHHTPPEPSQSAPRPPRRRPASQAATPPYGTLAS
eukprot:4849325-Pyramimonas_sp.AAC.1